MNEVNGDKMNFPGIFLQGFGNFGGGYGGSGFADALFRLEQLGLFEFILPMLLMFAVVFGVLSYTKIFGDNKGLHAIIAIVISLLAIRFPEYRAFLAVISPRLGIGLVILLALVILIGLFTTNKSKAAWGWIFITIAVIIAFVIFYQSASIFGFPQGYLESDLVYGLLTIAVVIGIVVVVIVASNKNDSSGADKLAALWDGLTNGKK